MTDDQLAGYIAKEPHGRASFKNLARELQAKGEDRDRLQSSLDRLVEKGLLLDQADIYGVIRKHYLTFL